MLLKKPVVAIVTAGFAVATLGGYQWRRAHNIDTAQDEPNVVVVLVSSTAAMMHNYVTGDAYEAPYMRAADDELLLKST